MNRLAAALGVEVPDSDVEMEVDMKPGTAKKSGFETVQAAVEMVSREGFSATQILTQVSVASKALVLPSTKARLHCSPSRLQDSPLRPGN